MTSYCGQCSMSMSLVEGKPDYYAAGGPKAIQVTGRLSCGHDCSFITSTSEWAKWEKAV